MIHRKVCNLEPSVGVAAPSLQLLHCSASSQAVASTSSVTYHHHQQQQLQHSEQSVQQYEEIRQNQIQSLAEELRKTSLKNVTATSSGGGPLAEVGEAPVPAPRRPKQRARRNSEGGGRWRITSFSVEESAAAAQSGAALQCSQEGSSRVTQSGHVSQSQQFSCQQESGEHTNMAAAGQQCTSTSQQSSTGQQGPDTRSGVMKHVPSFLSLLPRRQDPEPRPAPAPAARRASVSCVPGVSGRSSRAPSVESAQSRARPIFSFLRQGDGQQDNPHRTRCRYFIRVKNILLHIAGRILH